MEKYPNTQLIPKIRDYGSIENYDPADKHKDVIYFSTTDFGIYLNGFPFDFNINKNNIVYSYVFKNWGLPGLPNTYTVPLVADNYLNGHHTLTIYINDSNIMEEISNLLDGTKWSLIIFYPEDTIAHKHINYITIICIGTFVYGSSITYTDNSLEYMATSFLYYDLKDKTCTLLYTETVITDDDIDKICL